MSRMKATHEDFVIAWATSKTLDEVCNTTDMTKAAVQGRAQMLRKKGVKLPKLQGPTVLTEFRVAQLNSLINKHDIRKK
jgi:biotin operon repressor